MVGKKVVMVIAPSNFRDEELLKPKRVLESAGASVRIASKGVPEAAGVLGARVKVDMDLPEVNVEDYDAVVFIGGGGASVYFNDEIALDLAQKSFDAGKVTAAICIAPVILANAGILKGKKATSWTSPTDKSTAEALKAGGAKYVGNDVVVDGFIVTANGPGAAEEFGRKLVQLLST